MFWARQGRTAVRPYGITPDFYAAFKQTWYKIQIPLSPHYKKGGKRGIYPNIGTSDRAKRLVQDSVSILVDSFWSSLREV